MMSSTSSARATLVQTTSSRSVANAARPCRRAIRATCQEEQRNKASRVTLAQQAQKAAAATCLGLMALAAPVDVVQAEEGCRGLCGYAPVRPLKVATVEETPLEEQSPLVQELLRRSKENKEKNDKERFDYSTQYESYFAFDQLVNGGSASCVDPDSPYFDSPQCQQGTQRVEDKDVDNLKCFLFGKKCPAKSS